MRGGPRCAWKCSIWSGACNKPVGTLRRWDLRASLGQGKPLPSATRSKTICQSIAPTDGADAPSTRSDVEQQAVAGGAPSAGFSYRATGALRYLSASGDQGTRERASSELELAHGKTEDALLLLAPLIDAADPALAGDSCRVPCRPRSIDSKSSTAMERSPGLRLTSSKPKSTALARCSK